ncbi:MAG: hypothetical protein OXU65_01240 [Deltaproteobacteria bacterium]|nr:hypothetical protein [Deltaproteobacteria bacterium]
MTELQKALKKKIWAGPAVSWTGLCVFVVGMLVTNYILYERLSLERSEYLSIAVIGFWSYLYALALFQRRYRLGFDRDHEEKLRKIASSPGETLTRWQAFQLRNYGWTLILFCTLGAITAGATLMAGVFVLDHFWPEHPESMTIVVVIPLLIFLAIMIWRKQRSRDATPKGDEA